MYIVWGNNIFVREPDRRPAHAAHGPAAQAHLTGAGSASNPGSFARTRSNLNDTSRFRVLWNIKNNFESFCQRPAHILHPEWAESYLVALPAVPMRVPR
jgi:hypothetical protein